MRRIRGSDETEAVPLVAFQVHDLDLSHENLFGLSAIERERLIAAYNEEMVMVRALDGFTGDVAALLARLRAYMEYGAILARAQLFYGTADRAQLGLHCLYTSDSMIRAGIDEFTNWLGELQDGEQNRRDELLTRAAVSMPHSARKH
jgi:hypothetical protein